MGKSVFRLARGLAAGLVGLGILWQGAMPTARGCTIFVLTDGSRTLFFNNEDWENPVSRIWFVPAPEGFYSCAYVGFANNGAEGGMNSAGLAFDWVAGFDETWEPYAKMETIGGRTSERMLASCGTVEEAIAFYERYREPQFHRAKIMVADKSGASAIIGAHDGKLEVKRANSSRGFGYGRETLKERLKPETGPETGAGLELLRACKQEGRYATKYSNVFDLGNGEILISVPGGSEEARLNLSEELKRGGHYYDMPELRKQLGEAPRPLLSNMRSFLREFAAADGGDPAITAKVGGITRGFETGKARRADFAPEMWKNVAREKESFRKELVPFGRFGEAVFAGRSGSGEAAGYRYRLEFAKASVVADFGFDRDGKISRMETLGVEWKDGAQRVK